MNFIIDGLVNAIKDSIIRLALLSLTVGLVIGLTIGGVIYLIAK